MAFTYILNKTETKKGINFLNLLQKNLTLIKEPRQTDLCNYFDTFDWRLFRQGYQLYHSKGCLYLFQISKNKIEEKQDYHTGISDVLELASGNVYDKISPYLGVRALMCRATFQLTNNSFRILNRDDKTIARIEFEQAKIKEKTKFRRLQPYFVIRPLRGYSNQVSSILKRLSEVSISYCKDDRLSRGLEIIGEKPGDYSSKLAIKLTNRMSALEATKEIYLYLLDIIQRNESGIIKDIDIEFLHDFRVSIRRTRSALGQIKGVLDQQAVIKAKENFSFLGRSTNTLRDIDVYLLRENQYKMMLPAELRSYLDPFFKDLSDQRIIQHRELLSILRSVKYKRIMSGWKTYLNNQTAAKQKNSFSARVLAQTIIMKRNKKVLKFGQKILSNNSDELLHQLRIEGKRLRYLLEFFSSLFVQEKIQLLISKLKILQDNLGDFNDLVVQQKHLFEAINNISTRSKSGKNSVLALGYLSGKLSAKQEQVKSDFAKSFSNYSDPNVQKVFNELFKVQGRRIG